MKKILIFTALIIAVLTISPAYAKVSSDEARRVIDYYHNGSGGGAVFLEAALCKEVVKEGPNKNNCGPSIDSSNFPLGDVIVVWGSFLVPMGDTDTIYVEFENMGMVWQIRELNVKGALRYRSWASYRLRKPGKWTISLKALDEENQQSILLKELEVTVK